MRYLGVLVLVFLVAELLSVVVVAKLLGGLLTFVLMVAGFMAGSYLMRGQGGLAKAMLGGALMRGNGKVSLYQMLWPVRIPFAGLLLMMPGFLSSLAALLLLLPFKGKPLPNGAAAQGQGGFQYRSRTQSYDDGDIIEGDFVVRGKQPDTPPRQDVIEHK